MSVPLLLDENIEHEVYHRLERDGYEVAHVDFHSEFQKGADDETLAAYSLAHDVCIVTYDDDFETHYDESQYWGVLFLSDNDWAATTVAETLTRILELYDESSLQGMNVVGREWL